jgi:class 3 adenylate cyclase
VSAPEIRYARSGDAAIAYAVTGSGPLDLVFIPGGFQHLGLWWENERAAFGRRLSAITRLIQFDKRGTGLSDRGRGDSLETRMDDIRAVMDAAGSTRAVVFAVHDTAPLALLFAATFPERVAGLVLWHPASAFVRVPDQPWLPTRAEYEGWIEEQARRWGEHDYWDEMLQAIAPSLTTREERMAFARVLRFSVSPGDARAFGRTNMDIDVRHVLPAVAAPTLVLARESWGEEITRSRYHAERIPNARLNLVAGADRIPSVGDHAAVVAAVAGFLDEVQQSPPAEPERVLATVLFTDIVGSTERAAELGDAAWRNLLRSHHGLVRRELARYRGREMDTAGDGFFATFDGPARAIRCACAVRDAVRELDLEIRAGLHAGECEFLDGKAAGIAVSIGARVASTARGGEVLVSSTVRDLVAGSGIAFDERGEASLKGVPGEWRLFASPPRASPAARARGARGPGPSRAARGSPRR